MFKKIKSILFVVCLVMVFTAQTKRPDDKGQQHAPLAKQVPLSRPVSVAHNSQPRPIEVRTEIQHNNQSRPQAQVRTQASRPDQSRQRVQMPHIEVPQPLVERRSNENEGPRVYAVPEPAPTRNSQLFGRQHHNHWQPLYNFYNNQYQFYPYVNVTSTVGLSANVVSVLFNGQAYYYDQGSFYVQTPQGYLATPPPIGIIVSVLPSWVRQINVDGQIYYRCKGAFYVQAAEGYQVIAPVVPVPG